MTSANVLNLQGSQKGSVELSEAFSEAVRDDLIRRAVIAENTLKLQPQGHYILAGMNTTARYYGTMSSYRSGRHMGIAIRPRQKLGGGVQGQVRRIPSSVKGKRAHPHVIQKTLIERINKKEYQKAIKSSIAATANSEYVLKKHTIEGMTPPFIVSNDIESIKRTKDLIKILNTLKFSTDMEKSKDPQIRKGLRRLSARRHFRKSLLIVVNEDKGVIKAARNIPGVDACTLKNISANLLAPGGVPGRITLWSEDSIKHMQKAISELSLSV
jgi:large subunit ribosomal protein L4e